MVLSFKVSKCQGVRVSRCHDSRVSGCQVVRLPGCQVVRVSGGQGFYISGNSLLPCGYTQKLLSASIVISTSLLPEAGFSAHSPVLSSLHWKPLPVNPFLQRHFLASELADTFSHLPETPH